MTRGQLRIYLGAAPGVGKTYEMLEEAHRRKGRGADVVIGLVEAHGREHTLNKIGDLEVVPRTCLIRHGVAVTEMDVDAVLARRPQVVLVDELAHRNAPGSRHATRWQDVQELLRAGITVLSTLNIHHLESLNDAVHQITGVRHRDTVPDAVVRLAEQVELVDMTPEALRRRVVHGKVYPPEKVDAALGNHLGVGNLTALRELALLWLADKIDEQLDQYRAGGGIDATWEARERVVVGLTGGTEGETLIRRANRIAARSKGAELFAVHVTRNDTLAGTDPTVLAKQRGIVESLGGSYHQVAGGSVPIALLEFARGINATQLVLGASRRGRLAQLLSTGVGMTAIALSGPIDVHLVTHDAVSRRRRGRRRTTGALPAWRRLAGLAITLFGLPLLTLALHAPHQGLSLASNVLVYLGMVVAVALVGGWWPALLGGVLGFLLLNFSFTEPTYTFLIEDSEDVLTLTVFLLVAMAVSAVVDLAARRSRQAARATADAGTLAAVAGGVLRGARPLPALLERLRETFGLAEVTLLERRAGETAGPHRQRDPAAWRIAAGVGDPRCTAPGEGDVEVPVDGDLVLVLRGRPLAATDRRIVEAFAAQAAIALRQERLTEQAARARALEEADKLRTALLAAVSHDLRTPLAAASAAVESLRTAEVDFSPADQQELLSTAGESLDRLARLVDNLLDMSRLQAGALGVVRTSIWMEEAVPRALDELGEAGHRVGVRIPDDLQAAHADPGLLQRVLVNLLGNALRFSPSDRPPVVTASEQDTVLEVRIVDHGPGIPEDQHDQIFLPFQRLGDRDNHTGVGLGLALSLGLLEAMGGSLTPQTTPGGGLTMVLTLPAADVGASRRPQPAGLSADPAVRRRPQPAAGRGPA